jgi:sugar/nucleoside kinase (ribokinase family)
VAKDLTPEGPKLGGTAAFASLTARALDYAPGIVTACAADLDLSPLEGIQVACQRSERSTTFENIYGPDGRTQFLRDRAAPLTAAHVPAAWRAAPVVHLAPLAQEMDAGILAALDHGFVGLTPQGWLREWDADGRVTNTVRAWPQAADVLPRTRATVLSIVDIDDDWAVAEAWAAAAPVLVVTQGALGCTVYVRGSAPRQFPAPHVEEADPTGAGDVFAAAFFIHLYETDDPWSAARFANQVAALSVTRAGVAGVPTPEEVGFCRARAASG